MGELVCVLTKKRKVLLFFLKEGCDTRDKYLEMILQEWITIRICLGQMMGLVGIKLKHCIMINDMIISARSLSWTGDFILVSAYIFK